MKIIFISGVKFGYDVLSFILKHDLKISLILSYDESKSEKFSDYASFDDIAQKYKINHIKIDKINEQKYVKIIKNVNPDLILVMGFSQLLDENILNIPKIGSIGSHPTELPKYRGRSPIPWSILKKIKKSALTFFWLTPGIDNGDILDQEFFEIDDGDDSTTLYRKITLLGQNMLLKNLQHIENGILQKIPQDESKFIENWPKRSSEDGRINWNNTAEEIHLLIRATTNPYPGAFTNFKGSKLIIWNAEISAISRKPSEIFFMNKNILIGTAHGSIIIKKASIDFQEFKVSEIFKKDDEGFFLNDS